MFGDEGFIVKVGVVLFTKLFILRFLASSKASSSARNFFNKLVGARSGVGNLDYSTNRGKCRSFFNYPKDLLYSSKKRYCMIFILLLFFK